MAASRTATDASLLVVSDDPDAASFLAAVIRRGDIACTPASSELAAAAIAQTSPPFSMVAIDSTVRAVRWIRALADPALAATPIVFLGTPNAEAAEEAKGREAGATHWIARPVEEEAMLEQLHTLIDETLAATD